MKTIKTGAAYFLLFCFGVIAGGILFLSLAISPKPDMQLCAAVSRLPSIKPDYVNVTIPPNIAPLNFMVEEPGEAFFVRLAGQAGACIEIASKKPGIKIPFSKWKRFLSDNAGRSYRMDICVKKGKHWVRFTSVSNEIAREKIDPYCTYRKLATLFFNPNPEMGIYQRDIENFEERLILHRRQVGNYCINCHTSGADRTETMLFHVRRSHDRGPGMVIMHRGTVRFEANSLTPRGLISLTSIHPDGTVMAFAAVKMGFFSFIGNGSNDDRLQFEYSADLGLYDIVTGETRFVPQLSTQEYNETWPNWSGDGTYLYFSRCKVLWPSPKPNKERVLPENYKDVKYDLMRVSYEAATRTFGEPETLLTALETGKSCLQPSVSNNGRFVAFFLDDYGPFPINNPESDMYLMDMKTRTYSAMACNSPQAESMVRWSANDRWILFGSKRRDILYTRLYFAYVDENGQSRRAVELPQEDPLTAETDLRLFTTASFLKDPHPYNSKDLINCILAQDSKDTVHAAPGKDGGRMPNGEQQR
jgi:Tol biopolymer transport system component